MSTSNTTIYINAAQNVESQSEDVYVKDIGSLACSDEHVLAKVKAIKLQTGDQPAEGDPGDRKDLSWCQCGEHR